MASEYSHWRLGGDRKEMCDSSSSGQREISEQQAASRENGYGLRIILEQWGKGRTQRLMSDQKPGEMTMGYESEKN